jgi:ubiquinone/menaquinone biosynthesis C-methylase UbiE
VTNPEASKYDTAENETADVNPAKIGPLKFSAANVMVQESKPGTNSYTHSTVSHGNVTYAASLRDRAAGPQAPGRLSRLATSAAIRRQRRAWSRRADGWDHHAAAGMDVVTGAVLAAVVVRPGDQVVDLGCGTGQLSLPLAERGARVLAVDVSAAMVARLEEKAAAQSVLGLEGLASPIENLSLPDGSVDLIVTSYTLHHLRDVDKNRLVTAAYRWLRPGGTLLVADMMFGRGGTSRDRAIIRAKVKALAKKGAGGWWRIAKNGYRYLVRAQERPVSISAWTTMLSRAGFGGITASSIVAEAGLVWGQRPHRPEPDLL